MNNGKDKQNIAKQVESNSSIHPIAILCESNSYDYAV
jgi:hypothetical protein